jgi:TolA-binding protein
MRLNRTSAMQNFPIHFSIRHRHVAVAALLLLSGASLLRGQNSPPSAPPAPASRADILALNEDVQALQRSVNTLSDALDQMKLDNANLKKQILTQQAIETLIQNDLAKNRADTTKDIAQALAQSNTDLRASILAAVNQQFDQLQKDTNAALKQLANEIGQKAATVQAVAPLPGPPPNPNARGYQHTMVKGEYLSTLVQSNIAAGNKITLKELLSYNPQITDPKNVRAGQQIFVPLKDGATAPSGN